MSPDRLADFRELGVKERHFFPHDVVVLPKPGPDGALMAERLCPNQSGSRMWEIVLYATSPTLDEFPPELFFDDDVVWHQQQFGRPGQIATANLVSVGRSLYGMNYLGDVVQRISRQREWKTKIDNRFKGWPRMLLNAILDFAIEHRFRTFYSPTADLVLEHTDPAREVQRPLFDRVYDAAVLESLEARREGKWWAVPVRRNRRRRVRPECVDGVTAKEGPVVCLLHDIERGLGHLDVEPAFAERGERLGRESLPKILEIESQAGVAATYSVVGCFFDEVRGPIAAGGHALAFHSFNHRLEESDQLSRCRGVDYRIKGYRPPRSELTEELTDEALLRWNFEWIASAEPSWRRRGPELKEGLVRIPVHGDDFPLHTAAQSYEEWERDLLTGIESRPITVFGLHDCYADHWLSRFPRLLERIRQRATFKTLDELSIDSILAAAC
jgi:hypothetical protein